MSPNNPYIDIVRADNDIFDAPEESYMHKGRWADYFGNANPLVLEIGTGMGNFFSRQVGLHADKNFIGMEIKFKRCYQTAEKSRKHNQNNFTIIKEFAQKTPDIFKSEELSETYIFFPDPWANKDRQRKHRIMQEGFLKNLHDLTKKGGRVFFKTDHKEYFQSTLDILESMNLWKIEKVIENYEDSKEFDMKNITEFESFYRGEKTDINYLELVK